MTKRKPIRKTRCLLPVLFWLLVLFGSGAIVCANLKLDEDELTRPASWQPAQIEEIKSSLSAWLVRNKISDGVHSRIGKLLANAARSSSTPDSLDLVIEGLAMARPDINQLRLQLEVQRDSSRPPDFSYLIENPAESAFLRNHVRLFYARWLTQNEFYDEAYLHFREIDVENVVDPATLLFYRSVVEHQLLKKDECLATINRLLENADQLPRRFKNVAKLMLADIEPLETDSLDEISRLMNDIRRRTELHRSGTRVRNAEQAVIKKLDLLIEKLESQQQSQQAASQDSAPANPMQDSQKASGKGDGQVTSRRTVEGGSWGDLPPADRAAALAEMAKDMPPHYRAVIEEYFKRLARENEND